MKMGKGGYDSSYEMEADFVEASKGGWEKMREAMRHSSNSKSDIFSNS
jgi:hypothetical protein